MIQGWIVSFASIPLITKSLREGYVLDAQTRPGTLSETYKIPIQRVSVRCLRVTQPALRNEFLGFRVYLLIKVDVHNRHRYGGARRNYPFVVGQRGFQDSWDPGRDAVGKTYSFSDASTQIWEGLQSLKTQSIRRGWIGNGGVELGTQGIVDSLIGQNVIGCIAESPRGGTMARTNNSLSFMSQAKKRLFSGWKIGLQDFMEDGRLLWLFFCLPMLPVDAKSDSVEILRGFSLVDIKDARTYLRAVIVGFSQAEGSVFEPRCQVKIS